ncbi:MAG: Lacal_2735 family protein [Flavobacteriales bacterium]|nr:Lacal_2735 family protein [Bacteroidota bacterium]MCB9242000.1 Lacal_2735 family protein [Flavobacteriales bacterium]
MSIWDIFTPSKNVKKLERKRSKLLEQAFQLSRTDRKAADELYSQAQNIEDEIERITGQ